MVARVPAALSLPALQRIFPPETGLTARLTGNRQEAYPPHSQAPACYRRCLPRRHQGAPRSASRGPRRRPPGRHHRRQGEEGRRRVEEEGREGQERHRRRTRPDIEDPEQAGRQGCCTQGPGKDSLSGLIVCMARGSGSFSRWLGVPLLSEPPLRYQRNGMNGMMIQIFGTGVPDTFPELRVRRPIG
jgi:hypothetical protein